MFDFTTLRSRTRFGPRFATPLPPAPKVRRELRPALTADDINAVVRACLDLSTSPYAHLQPVETADQIAKRIAIAGQKARSAAVPPRPPAGSAAEAILKAARLI
jgi:hypothetical protein